MSFSRLIGQKNIKLRLSKEIMGQPSHAVLFTGSEGIGKHEFAREFSKALMCSNPTEDGACGKCNNCTYFDAGSHPDFILIEADSDKKFIKVDDIRNKVISDVKIGSQISKRKVYMINANELNEEGQNALLKSIEEPPENINFVLICEDSSRLLPTVCSRTNEYKLVTYTFDEVKEVVGKLNQEKYEGKFTEEELNFVSNFSTGIIGRAIGLLGDTNFKDNREQLVDLVTNLDRISFSELLGKRLSFFEENQDNNEELLLMILWLIGDMCVLYKDRNSNLIKNVDYKARIVGFLDRNRAVNLNGLGKASASITQVMRMLNVNVNYTLAISDMLLVLKKELGHD